MQHINFNDQKQFADFLQDIGGVLLRDDKESMTGTDLKKAGSVIKELITDMELLQKNYDRVKERHNNWRERALRYKRLYKTATEALSG
tara:strand:+ start:188 stop:451 length:264 start_codon:yes stop_codon:yes gene_type:complete